MKHFILFENCDNKWDNALPLGNGCFGAMLYFEKNKLHMPMNHYEIYYNIAKEVRPQDMLKAHKPVPDPGGRFSRFKAQAIGNQPTGDEPYCNYDFKKSLSFDKSYTQISQFSSSYPPTGDVIFHFHDDITKGEQSLVLSAEDAKVELNLTKGENALNLSTIIARKDCILNHLRQSKNNLLSAIEISFPPQRDLTYPEVTYKQLDDSTFAYTVKRHWDADSNFTFSGIVSLCGAKAIMVENEFGATIQIESAEQELTIITGIFTDWHHTNPLAEGTKKMETYACSLNELYKEHAQYWHDFFARSSISIPDRFLENIYYVNQYALDCSSGKNGIMKHHACGLNGLWDVRHPNLWGSMWYWDVNIQAAFAGVFSSNRLDLAKVFSDGLLSYVELAEKFAVDVHNLTGVAGDYPHCTYYCMWAWCAQYLWFLYEYSLDKDYLKNEAFPLFVRLCDYYLKVFVYDKERGYYSIFPDVSPEQGPFAHDTVITVASVKYLLQFTLKSAEILGETPAQEAAYRNLLNNMAPYPISDESIYGRHIKDSGDAPDNMWIRHPSLLMPLFPIGEFDIDSTPEMVNIWSNTIDFLEDRNEIGVFPGSWIAAAAARLGRGQTAMRLLYERGIDHMLRSNGLTAEETDHFINHCLVPRQPLYYPCMMEYTGEMLVAVNEMLLQSHNDIIRVFPALPDGDPEYGRLHRHGYPINEYDDRFATYPSWDTVRFDKLLAKGAFSITASITERRLDFILVHSQKGGQIQITSPYLTGDFSVYCEQKKVHAKTNHNILSFATEAGKTYLIARHASTCTKQNTQIDDMPSVLSHESYMKRHIFLGENQEALYQKAVDGFIRDWYVGNVRMENHTVYKFDFSLQTNKNYTKCMARQALVAEERSHIVLPFNVITKDNLPFTIKQGYGFENASQINFVERTGPDLLRKDFVEGTDPCEFIIEAPRGQYELFVVSGDSKEDSITTLEAVNGRRIEGKLTKRGTYQCKVLPLVNEDDENIRLKISTKPGYCWKINYIILNAVKGY